MTYPKDNYEGWLMYHSVGLFPQHETVVGAALAGYNRQWCRRESPRWDYGLQARDKMLGLWSQLIHGDPANVFASENVTEAFGRFVCALGPARLRGKKVLIAADCFPSLHFLLGGLADRFGFDLVTVIRSSRIGTTRSHWRSSPGSRRLPRSVPIWLVWSNTAAPGTA
jgi:kynureninase